MLAVSASTSYEELGVWRTLPVGLGGDLGLKTPLGKMCRFKNWSALPSLGVMSEVGWR